MATENIIMALVDKGVSRQDAHEEIRVLSHQAGAVVKQEGKLNDLLDRIKITPFFEPVLDQLDNIIDARTFIGRSAEIVEQVVNTKVKAALEKYAKELEGIGAAELHV
jgi:adenylosuccinate lyase